MVSAAVSNFWPFTRNLRCRGRIAGHGDDSEEFGSSFRRLGRFLRLVQDSTASFHTQHVTHCSDEKVVWELKRHRLEGTTLLEFSPEDSDQILREISLEGVILFKNVGAKVGLPNTAPCICLESLGLAQSNAREQLKKVISVSKF